MKTQDYVYRLHVCWFRLEETVVNKLFWAGVWIITMIGLRFISRLTFGVALPGGLTAILI
jgi:hypothetical protein